MGSFNEVCALSGLNISYGTPIRLLFLTKNPYVSCDQHEAHRGCYHYDQWFVRTPPIKGEYADYGQCKFKKNLITKIIHKCFQNDAIERPFGFNQYHAGDVTKKKDIHHFLQAAWQGRLLVEEQDAPKEDLPAEFPTWQKVHAILKKASLPIQSESKSSSGKAGYNAQPIMRGIVCVTFNSYDDCSERLNKASEILSQNYECRILLKFKDSYEKCLVVTRKGAFDNPDLLHDNSAINNALTTHPELPFRKKRCLPVLAVMIREDVWQAYCGLNVHSFFEDKPKTVEERFDCLKNVCDEASASKVEYAKAIKEDKLIDYLKKHGLRDVPSEMFRSLLVHLPFQTSAGTHLAAAIDVVSKDELLRACAELSHVETVMGALSQAWYIPSLGGQDGAWELRTKLLGEILAISQKELAKESSYD